MILPTNLNKLVLRDTPSNASECEIDDAVDPDVAGIGVMIAALLSTIITILYIFIGWTKNWIRGFSEHPADVHIRRWVRCSHWRRNENPTAKGKSQKAFEAVILAFSDQQLVTGLALLISIYIKRDITVYTFQVATTVAWFSSTTHLATLVALREYLRERENRIIRFCRIAFMVPNAGLLLASQIRSNGVNTNDPNIHPWTAMRCVKTNRSVYGAISISFISAWLVFAFINRIVNICYEQSLSERSWLFEFIVNRCDKLKPDGQNGKWSTDHERFRERLTKLPETRSAAQELTLCAFLLLFFMENIMGSLYWEILWLFFSLAYGLTGIVVTWAGCSQPSGQRAACWPKILEMGLGQMIPLVMLILPAFSFLESFAETHESEEPASTSPDGAVQQKSDDADVSDVHEAADRKADDQPSKNRIVSLLSANIKLAQNTQKFGEAVTLANERLAIRQENSPYQTVIGKWIAIVTCIYLFCLFVAGGILANGGATTSEAGLLITLLLVLALYFLGAAVEIIMLIKAYHRDQDLKEDQEDQLQKSPAQPILIVPGRPLNIFRDHDKIAARLCANLMNDVEMQELSKRIIVEAENLHHDIMSASGHDAAAKLKRIGTQLEGRLRTPENEADRGPHEDNSILIIRDGQLKQIAEVSGPSTVNANRGEASNSDHVEMLHAAQSKLEAVRERHRKIQDIESRFQVLAGLINDLEAAEAARSAVVDQVAEYSENNLDEATKLNAQLDKTIRLGRGIRRAKWWCIGIGGLTVLILALVLGLYFGLRKK